MSIELYPVVTDFLFGAEPGNDEEAPLKGYIVP